MEEQGKKSLEALIKGCPVDPVIGDNLIKSWAKINSSMYNNIICTVSGGSDSDIVVDICQKCDKENKITFVWFDTGLEYNATKRHLIYLEKHYGIRIERHRAKKTIPAACREYGQPFLSKRVSDYMQRLQKHGFLWEDEPFEKLVTKYCKWVEKRRKWVGCYTALKWWCNRHESARYNISYNRWLKEFIIKNPPMFQISVNCCKYAKKDLLKKLIRDYQYDLNLCGVRRAEGGTRASAYKTCFSKMTGGCDEYRPVFWYLNETKRIYNQHYGIQNSDCYRVYGLSRTGCAGCPFSRNLEEELRAIEKYEPGLFCAVQQVFHDSYDYTRRYRSFCEGVKTNKERETHGKKSPDYHSRWPYV